MKKKTPPPAVFERELDAHLRDLILLENAMIELEVNNPDDTNIFMARLCAHKAVTELRFVVGYLKKARLM